MMPDWLRERLRDCPSSVRETLLAVLDGRLAAGIALSRLFLALHDAPTIASLLSRVEQELHLSGEWQGAQRIQSVRALLCGNPTALNLMGRVVARLDGERQPQDQTESAAIASFFDAAAEVSPEASVALYSLGDPALLATATDEIVAFLLDRGLLSSDMRVLEIGCGIGRFARALAPHVQSFTGVDVSHTMIRIARQRCAGLRSATLDTTSGDDLAQFADRSFQLVLAVDSFPYMTAPGVAEVHISESARVLAPKGSLVIFNFSYVLSFTESRETLEGLGKAAALHILAAEPNPLRSWDGCFFHLRKQG